MSTTVTQTTDAVATLSLRPQEEYKYAHLLPHFSTDTYPPLIPYDHVDPGARALSHPNPRAFLDSAREVNELTPRVGTEIIGLNLAELDDNARDQLALEV